MAVIEKPGDEKSGQHKEQVDAEQPVLGHGDDGALDPVGRQHRPDEVKDQNHQHGQATDPIEDRQMSPQAARRTGG